jgi:1,4-dihydroxy-2-naphthoate octaprenyltransferase
LLLATYLWLCHPIRLLLVVAPVLLTLELLWASGLRLLPIPAASTLLAAVLALAGGSLLDEYLAFERAAAHGRTNEPGLSHLPGARMATSPVYTLTVLRLSISLLALGALAGIPSALSGGVWTIILGVGALLLAFLYSATSYAWKRLPASAVIVALALGPGLVFATTLAQHQPISWPILTLGLALGCAALTCAQAHVLASAAATTTASRRAGRILCALALVGAYAFAVILASFWGIFTGAVAAFLSLPAAVLALTGIMRAQSPIVRALALRQMTRAYLLYALWLFTGILAAYLIIRFAHALA